MKLRLLLLILTLPLAAYADPLPAPLAELGLREHSKPSRELTGWRTPTRAVVWSVFGGEAVKALQARFPDIEIVPVTSVAEAVKAVPGADVLIGGIGKDNDWTLTIVRTELGEEVINRMIADGSIIAKPAQEDEEAMRLLRLLSIVSRRRWPKDADPAPAMGLTMSG